MADVTTTIYTDLKNALDTFRDFLTTNVPLLVPVVKALKLLGNQVDTLLTSLLDLMSQLRSEINALDLSSVSTSLGQLTTFATATTTLLNISESLLPNDAAAITKAKNAVAAIAGLQQLTTTVQTDIIAAIDAIVVQLNSLKNA
jgi:hypothetical protein